MDGTTKNTDGCTTAISDVLACESHGALHMRGLSPLRSDQTARYHGCPFGLNLKLDRDNDIGGTREH